MEVVLRLRLISGDTISDHPTVSAAKTAAEQQVAPGREVTWTQDIAGKYAGWVDGAVMFTIQAEVI